MFILYEAVLYVMMMRRVASRKEVSENQAKFVTKSARTTPGKTAHNSK
jgi:hypothetical protein